MWWRNILYGVALFAAAVLGANLIGWFRSKTGWWKR